MNPTKIQRVELELSLYAGLKFQELEFESRSGFLPAWRRLSALYSLLVKVKEKRSIVLSTALITAAIFGLLFTKHFGLSLLGLFLAWFGTFLLFDNKYGLIRYLEIRAVDFRMRESTSALTDSLFAFHDSIPKLVEEWTDRLTGDFDVDENLYSCVYPHIETQINTFYEETLKDAISKVGSTDDA